MNKKYKFSSRNYVTTGEILYPINNQSTFDITGINTGSDSSGCYSIILQDFEDDIYITNIDNSVYLLNPSLDTPLLEYDDNKHYSINNEEISLPYYPVDNTLFKNWSPFNYKKDKLKELNNNIIYSVNSSDWDFYKEKEDKLIMDEYTWTNNKRNDIVIEIPYNGSFYIGDYTFELRINGMVTKYFTISTTNNNSIIITIDINKYEKFTGSNNSDYITLFIRNKYNFDYYIKTFSKYTNNIRPFISYDKMTDTQTDITINCRFDVSVKTSALSKDVISDISKNIGNEDKDRTVDYIKFDKKKVVMGNNSINYLTFENISDSIYYILGKSDFIFNNDYFKTTAITITNEDIKNTYSEEDLEKCLYDGTNSLILKPKDSVTLTIQSFNNKYNDKLTFNFIKLNSNYQYHENRKKDLVNNIDCNIKILIGISISIPKDSYFTEDEKDILKNIATFDTSLISSTYGNIEQLVLSANNNILIDTNDPDNLNSNELKNLINNTHDMTLIDNKFKSYKLICYGVIVNYMVLTNPDIADIKVQVPNIYNDINPNSIDSLVDVCNIDNNPIDEKSIGKNYLNAFNEASMNIKKSDGKWCKKIIVPDTVFNLFNFTNIYDNAFILHPSMKFNIDFKNNLEKDTMNSKLCIDYKPVKISISKYTDKNIVWSLFEINEKDINTEKILDVISREPSVIEDDIDNSKSDGTNGTINDTSSIISYPEFINLDVTLDTENGIVNDIGYAEYNGSILYSGNKPIIIEPDIEKNTFYEFIKHSFDGIELKTYQVITDLDKNIVENITGYLLNSQEQLKIKVFNDQSLSNIPDKFGKSEQSISDILYEKIWYVEKDENDNISVRRNYGTKSTNMNINITVNPLVNADNTDSNIYKEIETVMNINTSEIYSRDVFFYLLKDEDTNIIDINNITLIDTIFNYGKEFYIDEENKRLCYVITDLTQFDMKDISFPESGIDYSYEEIKNKLNEKYKEVFNIDNDLTYGIEVVARTRYDSNNTNKVYNNAIITNYKDKNALKNDEKPKLNRLTGGSYHSLNILNKNEEFFEYKIIVDDIERNEGDVISNNSTEISLHKFRLYYRLKNTSDWLLADSFEGVIDGTKPIQPKLIFNNEPLEKYPLLNKEDAISLLSNFESLLSEYNYYNKNVNIYSAINQEFNMSYTKDFINIKGPKGKLDNILIQATDKIYGSFVIENTSKEIIRCIINPDRDIANNITITSNLLSSSIYQPNKNLQPIYNLQPNSINTFYILFKEKNPTINKGKLEIKIQNNVNLSNSFKDFNDEIKWIEYYIDVESSSLSSYNKDILKNLTSYRFYGLTDEIYKEKEYYELDEIDNVIDFNNFNKPYLYKVQVYLDDILILDSNKSDKLLISERRLKYYLYNGQHNIHIQTFKFNGMINYNDYYITVVDTNDTEGNNYYTGISKDSENYNSRNKLVLRNDSNLDFTHENELFMNSLGHPSIVTKDINDKLFPYRITENINKYMDFSKYLIESNYTLHEYLQQNIVYYKNYIKENYDYFVEHGENRYSIGGTFDKLINNINSNFELFDKTLEDITNTINSKTNNSNTKEDTSINIDFSATFIEDNILQSYKTLFMNNVKKISFKLSNDFIDGQITSENYNENKDFYIIGDSNSSFRNINLEEASYITSSIQIYILSEDENSSTLNKVTTSGSIDYDNKTSILSIDYTKIERIMNNYNTNGKTKVITEFKFNSQSYYSLIIFENLKKLVYLQKPYQNINIFANTYEDKYKVIENNSDFPMFIEIRGKMELVNDTTVFPENMIYMGRKDYGANSTLRNVMTFLIKPNSIGKLHFKRDFNENIFPKAYESRAVSKEVLKDMIGTVLDRNDLCTDRIPSDNNIVVIRFDYTNEYLEKYTELNLSSINKLYFFDKEDIDEWETSFNFNIYSFRGFALSELFKDGVPSNDNIKQHEININFTEDNIDMEKLGIFTNTYYIIVNDLYFPKLYKQYTAYGEIHVNNTLNPEGVVDYLDLDVPRYSHITPIQIIKENYNLKSKKTSIFAMYYILQPSIEENKQNMSYLPIILTDYSNTSRKLTKNDFIAFSLNLIEQSTINSKEYTFDDCFENLTGYYGVYYNDEYKKIKYDDNGKYYVNPVSNCDNRQKIKKSSLINNQVFYVYPNIQSDFSCNKLAYYRMRTDINNPYTTYAKFELGGNIDQDKIVVYPLGYINKNDKVNLNIPLSKSWSEGYILFDITNERTTCPSIYTKCTIGDISGTEFDISKALYLDNCVTLILDINSFEKRYGYNYFEGFYFEYTINNLKEKKIFLPFDKSSIDNMGYFYSLDDNNSIWNNLNMITDVFDTNLDLLENELKDTYKKLENMISISSILQINLNKQKKVLDTKATVNEYKIWLDKNFQKIASLYYRTNEFLTDVYTSSSKGLNITINETTNNLTTDLTPKGYAIFYDSEESYLNNTLLLNSHNVKHFIDKESINEQLIKMMNIEAYNFLDSLASYKSETEYNKYFACYKNKNYDMNDLRGKLEDYTSSDSFMTKLLNAVKSKDTKIFDYPDNFM